MNPSEIIAARELARSAHPETSKEAARHIVGKLPHLHELILERVRESPGLTASELAVKYAERDPRRIGRRLVELERRGLIYRSAVAICTVTDKRAAAWMPIPPEAK